MSNWLNNSKTAVFTAANVSKNSSTMKNHLKAGSGQKYDDSNLTYDELFDPITGNPVFYDGVGTTPVWTNQTKN